MGALNKLLGAILGILGAVLGAVLGIVAALVWLIGIILSATIILAPVGIPLVKLGKSLFSTSGDLMHLG
ncbi:hypothetical protein [Nocardia inohanensis]|uniref:hypothetical protein n=1 Tax=Nocardia inohanensis TaxID=209246 RepID=UPI00082F4783|nr:hypothetical protein [Nocardia inohanensis]